ncbi:aldo/keto reductase [Loigolactobacillus coryniformis]|jgi:2,5-diketo-D-gluconate reductase A|uniref:2,5-diketo-D-gluconic acid reductase n=1 Tax=Loigolactobacillus coryniformis subsp. torquens DSM 20004 = KCTC 3535 TaxID=1423822 RepID=A0A2D1KP15_9LACO|nr:aldo/keto reductase [Loigolactobacillus coryniformis]ATO43900.1 2,5-diketo-D-gluconic acid reductase [Loigolactobacillus coryniformis subsp. torquens DSM 20004 = KCTC 3535]KRK85299.1 oxidoreductase [Loigolactobacillus coryniformis subsp. torquens DSM 20004 = KCTC 3535]MCL5458611.1 aldo/keto reductase [Loigolactobacillus coryniformis]MDN5952888.1 aldo/keto reductase [Loigolactobacillus coryniformis]
MTNKVPMITLNNGVEMPQLGFGVFQVPDLSQAEAAVKDALEVGYRLIDTATAYQNEEAVGRAINNSGIKREDIFVTSKLWVSDFTYDRAKKGIDASLQRLNMGYMDLYLLHQPYGDVMGAWRALEEAYKAGKIRAIGVSNFYADQLKNLELTMTVQPVVNQIEVSPWYQQTDEVKFNQGEKVQVEAWAPFAEGKHDIFNNTTIGQIAKKYGKTNGQVILRWLLQRGITVIPKSVHRERMAENLAVFDFELTTAEMQTMATLDKKESQFFDHRDPVTIEQIFGSSLKQLH